MNDLQTRIMVTLYELKERGNKIKEDSPCMGAETPYGHWSKDHGLYRSRETAVRVQDHLIQAALKDGWKRSNEGKGALWKIDEDLCILIDTIEVEKKKIRSVGGKPYYQKQEIH
ncbi:MAG TPA: hypothetical protein VLJ21_01690 [Candidatus Binatia bacterium]|nr:hypothetical protein [Candidatus Binatia bacterium]